MVKQGVDQNGHLCDHPFGELIREAGSVGLSGAFRLAQARVQSVVYFDAGNIVFAVSNVRAHRLSESARKWNFISQQQLAAAGTHESDAKLGKALVESGVLTNETLSELFSLQGASVLRPMLLWTEGTWTFDPRVRIAEDVQMRISMRELLIESARRLPPDFVAQRFGNTNELLTVNAEPPMDLALLPVEAFVLSRVDATGMRLHELLSISGLPETETFGSLYALALGGFLYRERWPRAFSDETVSNFRAIDTAVLKAQGDSKDPDAPVKDNQPVTIVPDVKEPEPEVDRQEEIDRFFFRVEAAEDFYEVLSVTHSADPSAIKKAYHALARRFHPDRFHQDAGTPIHSRLQATFARVAQAYEMLKDSKLRASYDLKLQAEKRMRKPGTFSSVGTMSRDKSQPGARPKARVESGNKSSDPTASPRDTEETFQRGVAALNAGNISLAVSLLADAAKREPDEARYRAFYGSALTSNKQMRHQAEAELKAAISLDANNASYRLMLAVLYSENGMKRRAQGEAQKVLVVDPYNEDALRLLQALTSSR